MNYDLLMRMDTRDLSLSFGSDPTYWFGQGAFAYAAPFTPGAENLPLFGGERLNIQLRRRSDVPIANVVRIQGLDETIALQRQSGLLVEDEEALCLWSEPEGPVGEFHAVAFVRDDSFSLLTQALLANQSQQNCLLIGAGFLGFRGPVLEGDALPSLEEFRRGRPYLYHQKFNFAVTASVGTAEGTELEPGTPSSLS